MTIVEAAKQLGMSPQTLRLALQQNLFPFGVATKTSNNRYTYYINEIRLKKYLEGEMYEREIINNWSGVNSNFGTGSIVVSQCNTN